MGYSVPPHPSYRNGPFLEDKLRDIPMNYVLSKTHCSFSFVRSLHSFESGCKTARRRFPQIDKTKIPIKNSCKNEFCFEQTFYDTFIVKKAVHLIRSPFDNVVARFNNPSKRNTTYT